MKMYDEDETNESEIAGKWCINPRDAQKADAYLAQIQNVARLESLGILWLIYLNTKFN